MAGARQQEALGELEVRATQQEAPGEPEGPNRRLPRSRRDPHLRRMRTGVTNHKSPTC
jgi:hypothetical protein